LDEIQQLNSSIQEEIQRITNSSNSQSRESVLQGDTNASEIQRKSRFNYKP